MLKKKHFLLSLLWFTFALLVVFIAKIGLLEPKTPNVVFLFATNAVFAPACRVFIAWCIKTEPWKYTVAILLVYIALSVLSGLDLATFLKAGTGVIFGLAVLELSEKIRRA